jgi:hypothetical protein
MVLNADIQLKYRLFAKPDTNAILDLWANHSGWGPITEGQFIEWNFNNPYEPNLIVIAENADGDVIGQETFIPTRIWNNGKEIKAIKAVAPILHRDFRQQDLRNFKHPALEMLKTGITEAIARGYGIGYSFPAHGWLSVAKLLPRMLEYPFQSYAFGCAAISLTSGKNYQEKFPETQTTIAGLFSPEYDTLWEEAKSGLPVQTAVIRNQHWLQWKFGSHIVVELRNAHGALRAYCAVRKNSGLIEDIFAVTYPEMAEALSAAVRALHVKNPGRHESSFTSLKIMMTDQVKTLLTNFDYDSVDFQFAFAAFTLDPGLDASGMHHSSWFMMPND